MSQVIYFWALLLVNMSSCLTWYRGNYINGDYSNSKTFGAYYSKIINKIILTQSYTNKKSNNVSLFDPYLCTFESINLKVNSFTSRTVTSVDDLIYIDAKSGSKTDNILSFDPLTLTTSSINFKATEDSCLMSDETNKKLYNVGGGDLTYADGCSFDDKICSYGESYTKVYSINNQISFHDASMNKQRRNAACVSYQNRLYVFGGDTKQVHYKAGLGNNGPYYTKQLSVETWNLNITNSQSPDYGWKYVHDISLISAYPSTIVFNNKIYLFNFYINASDNQSTIQIFDPLEHTITDDASSESFYIQTKNLWNAGLKPDPVNVNDPVNVDDELIYIFGSASGPDDTAKNTFSFGVVNDSVLNKLSPACFWNPTASPTMRPTMMPNKWPPTPSAPTHGTHHDGLSSEKADIFIIVGAAILMSILGIIICYVIWWYRKRKKVENVNQNNNGDIANIAPGAPGEYEGEGEREILTDLTGQIEGQTEMVGVK